MKEVWKQINNFEARYEISNLGRIKSLRRFCKTYLGVRTVNEKIKSLTRSSNGYLTVCLDKKTHHVHKLVFLHFVSNYIHKSLQINHIDGVKSNNRFDNLELLTASENRKHAFRIGLQQKPFGEKNPMSKITDNQRKEIISLKKQKIKHKKIAEIYGLSYKYISQIK